MTNKACSKCKVVKSLDDFYKKAKALDGRKSACKVCIKLGNSERESQYKEQRARYRSENRDKLLEQKRQYYQENKESHGDKQREWRQTFKGRLYSYISGAKKRDIPWELTEEEFKLFWDKDCKYCGTRTEGVGIDRVNSTKGYNLSNCVACCTKCNIMKTNYKEDEFLNHIKLIYKNIKK